MTTYYSTPSQTPVYYHHTGGQSNRYSNPAPAVTIRTHHTGGGIPYGTSPTQQVFHTPSTYTYQHHNVQPQRYVLQPGQTMAIYPQTTTYQYGQHGLGYRHTIGHGGHRHHGLANKLETLEERRERKKRERERAAVWAEEEEKRAEEREKEGSYANEDHSKAPDMGVK